MTGFEKAVRYLATAFAVFLAVSIIGGILGAVGLLGGMLTGDETEPEEMKPYTLSSEIHSLKMEIAAADVVLRSSDAFALESNVPNLTVQEKNGVLILQDRQKWGKAHTGRTLILSIPSDTELERMELELGAGRLTADCLCAETVKLELGAGEVNVDRLVAGRALTLEGGAGKITVSGGELHNPELEMGVGQLNLTAKLSGECTFDLGVGESNFTVLGKREAFALDIEKGIGEVRLDGKSISNFKEKGGKDSIEINGGIGAIRLDFKESGTAFG